MTAAVRVAHSASADTADVAVTGTGVQPQFSASTDTLDFGSVRVGQRGDPTPVTVTNQGNQPLEISDVLLAGANAGQFTKADVSCTQAPIPENQTCTVQVRFEPDATGAKTAVLRFSDNADGSPHDVAIAGTGVQPVFSVAPSAVDFRAVLVGQRSDPITLSVTNTGDAPLAVTGVNVTGAAAGQFAITDRTCTTAPLDPGAKCTVSVRFSPTSAGARAAVLRFADDAPGAPHQVTLAGTGVAPKPPAPVVTGISPAVGATTGGNPVVLRGQHLAGATVRFAGTAATGVSASAGELKVRAPRHTAGRVDVTVTSAGGSGKAPGGYVYVAAPAVGRPAAVAGGYQFTVSGLVAGAVMKPAAVVAGVSAVQVSGARITVKVKPTFSGKIAQPVAVTEGAAQFRLVLSVNVSSKAPTAVTYTPGARSTVRWTPAGNATGTQVLVANSLKCTTAARVPSCTVAGWLGPKSRVQVRSLGGSNTTSPLVTGRYRPPPVPALLATVKFKTTGKTLKSAAKRQLRRLAALVSSRGLPTLLVTGQVPAGKGKLRTRTRLARARATAVAKYLTARCRSSGGNVRITIRTATKPRRHTVSVAVT